MMNLDELCQVLDRVDELPDDQVPAGIGAVAKAQALLTRRLITTPAPAATAANPECLTAQEVAAIFHVPANHILALARQGRLPHHKLGKNVRFNVEELRQATAASGEGSETLSLRPRKKRSNGAASQVPATASLPKTTGANGAH
jgi:excisionase family DNA binding protein